MECSECQGKPSGKVCGKCGKLPPVIEIQNEECPILFHTVELDTSYEADPPYIGRYHNVLCVYKADDNWVLYNSDGIYSVFGANVNFNAILGRPRYAGAEMSSDTDIPDVVATVATETEARELADTALDTRVSQLETDLPAEVTARENADSSLQDQITTIANSTDLDVVTSTSLSNTASTVTLTVGKTNIKNSTTGSTDIAMPVASATQAGVINASTYEAITQNNNTLDALLNGSVAIVDLPAAPTQQNLTDAWKTATGFTSLINRASIFDVTNEKIWTYYVNDSTWHEADASATVIVNTFTNSSEGTIKGSTGNGKVFAESDGTGSVNGWDALSTEAANATTKLAGIENGAQVNVQADWNETDTTADDYIKNKPTAVSAFTNDANYVKVTASTTDIGEGATLANDTLYVVYS